MMTDGLANSKKYKLNSSNRTGMRSKRQRSTENSLRIIGKVSKSECKISRKLISRTPELLNMMATLYIEASSLRKASTIKNTIKYSTKIKRLLLIKKSKEVIDNRIFRSLKLTLKFGSIERNRTTSREKNKPLFSKRLYKKWRKYNRKEQKQ